MNSSLVVDPTEEEEEEEEAQLAVLGALEGEGAVSWRPGRLPRRRLLGR